MGVTQQILSQIPGNPWAGLQQAEQKWAELRAGKSSVPAVIDISSSQQGEADWDVAIAGATLGVVIGTALAQRGWRVLLLERTVFLLPTWLIWLGLQMDRVMPHYSVEQDNFRTVAETAGLIPAVA